MPQAQFEKLKGALDAAGTGPKVATDASARTSRR